MQKPSWVRPPPSYKAGSSSLVFAFEDPDGSRLKSLLTARYLYAFGTRSTVKKWKQRTTKHKLTSRSDDIESEDEDDVENSNQSANPHPSPTSGSPSARLTPVQELFSASLADKGKGLNKLSHGISTPVRRMSTRSLQECTTSVWARRCPRSGLASSLASLHNGTSTPVTAYTVSERIRDRTVRESFCGIVKSHIHVHYNPLSLLYSKSYMASGSFFLYFFFNFTLYT